MTTTSINIEAAKQRARAAIDGVASELIRISREIHANPELALKEHHAFGQLVPFADHNADPTWILVT